MQNASAIKTVLSRVPVEEIIGLRHRTLREGLGLDTARFIGDHDATTRHFAAYLAGENGRVASCEPICCASFMLSTLFDSPAWQLRGMATDTTYRRMGIGTSLLKLAEARLTSESTVRLFWCNARLPSVGFYLRNGWATISDVVEIPTAGPHRQMGRMVPVQK